MDVRHSLIHHSDFVIRYFDKWNLPPHALSATACPPNGSRTPPPGSPGRISKTAGPATSSRSRRSTRDLVETLARIEHVNILAGGHSPGG